MKENNINGDVRWYVGVWNHFPGSEHIEPMSVL